ncbi:Putative monooxygenase [Fundidesulfovibrio magnetotacticus]|uniref:Monooxygenase n=1 Tax=Fundidesulfovibrio magnetotacticus TaxID=2730080 RepID=A0A6V8LX36_9BACT|nr:putative quinol monooxygenase [Fundidesulfovibrio magnetotacticus]GFK92845.1 Putative monooxygenase [Fundidesulfovibrio magnetotacticus]
MKPVAVVATVVARPGCEAAVEARLRALVAPSRTDKGCIRYVLHKSQDDPRVFVFMEAWESRALLQSHLETEHIAAWRADAPELIESMDVKVLDDIA